MGERIGATGQLVAAWWRDAAEVVAQQAEAASEERLVTDRQPALTVKDLGSAFLIAGRRVQAVHATEVLLVLPPRVVGHTHARFRRRSSCRLDCISSR